MGTTYCRQAAAVQRPTTVAFLAGLLLLALQRADAAPPAGEILYRRYCAACHGVDGRGDGPAAAALCPRPPDLTRLGTSEPELMRQIDGRRAIRAHGTAAMPVWGEVFEQSLIEEPHRQRTALHMAQTLADYVQRLRRANPDE
jgi:mono/diheme cytochrome c family protein